ncbi:MAG: DedA family protein [Candidatus Gracilibacteria bacterium]|nr:DedA family protein [Candidatus Gracilibacteria bacterium]
MIKKTIKKLTKLILNFINILLVLLMISLTIISLFRPDLVKDAIEWIKNEVQNLGYWNYIIVGISSAIEGFPVLGIVIPGQNIMMIVGGFFGTKYIYYTIIAGTIGAILGNEAGFLLVKNYGEKFLNKYGDYFGIGKTESKYLRSWVEKYGSFAVILAKFHNVARAFMPFVLAGANMKHKTFFLYNVIGSIVRSSTMICIGVVFAANYEKIVDYMGYIIAGIMLLSFAFIYFFKKEAFMIYLNEKQAEIEEKQKR